MSLKKIFVFSFFVFCFSFLSVGMQPQDSDYSDFVFEWITQGDLRPEEDVFIRAFLKAYENFSEQDLGLKTSKLQFLQEAFAEQREDFQKEDGTIFTLHAKHEDKVVGVVFFNETGNKGEFYIRQLAVDPEYWRHGIGTKLVLELCNKITHVQRLVVVPRRINVLAQNFYKKLGFTESTYIHEGLDPKKYVGFEFDVKK